MSEAHVKEGLPLYLDDGLPAEEMRRVEVHLFTCRACREELACLRRIQRLLKARSEDSPGLWDAISERIGNGGPQSIWSQFEWVGKRMVPVLAAAAVLMLAVLGSLNGDDLTVMLEDYLKAQWDPGQPESIVLSETDFSRDDILRLTDSARPSQPQQR